MIANYCQTLTGAGFTASGFPNLLGLGWLSVVALGLVVSALGLVMAYLVSQWLRLPKLEAWTRFELFQLAATAVLAALIAWMVWGMCHFDASILSKDLYGGSGGAAIMAACSTPAHGTVQAASGGTPIVTPYCIAQNFLYKLKQRGDDVFQLLISLNYGFSLLFKTVWESRPMGIGYTLEPLAGFQQLQNVFLVAVSGFMVAYMSVLIQMRVLDFMLLAVPYFFLPLGLLLRALPPSREFGGAIVGFGMASLLFLPLILAMNDVVVYSSLEGVFAPVQKANAEFAKLQENTLVGTLDPAVTPLDQIKEGQTITGSSGTISGADGGPLTVASVLQAQADSAQFTGTDGRTYQATKIAEHEASVVRLGQSFNPDLMDRSRDQLTNTQAPPAGTTATQPADSSASAMSMYFVNGQRSTNNSTMLQTLTDAFFTIVNVVMIYFVAAVLLPIINFVIYLEVARTLTKLLGTEMDLSNLARLI